ncbi:MAG: hypothetical protein J6I96_06510 [Oscillospiraceae bacterium]|nr:hypothetical protein [Oscillospiraceae bacterium]
MKINEVFILTGWADCADSTEFTLNTPDGTVMINNDGQTDADGMIIIANQSDGTLFLGQTSEPVDLVLNIKSLMGSLPFLEWSVADAQAAFRGEYDCKRLSGDKVIFTAVSDGWSISVTDDEKEIKHESRYEFSPDDIDGNIISDLKMLSYYGSTSEVNRAKQLLNSRATVNEAERMIAELIKRSHDDLTKYRTEI